jgi:hypothetical protein
VVVRGREATEMGVRVVRGLDVDGRPRGRKRGDGATLRGKRKKGIGGGGVRRHGPGTTRSGGGSGPRPAGVTDG